MSRTKSEQPSATNDLRFPGQIHDRETDLHYNWHRYYDPKTGRYLQPDPLGLLGGMNPYAYVQNNPIRYIDVPGLKSGASPWQVGWEWLTGTGPRNRVFESGDPFLEELRRHEHIRNLLHDIAECNAPLSGTQNYDLEGWEGVPKYINDYSTLLLFGLTGNLAATYLGSYNLQYVTTITGNSATVNIHVWNYSTIASATHPPVVGYTNWWEENIGQPLNDLFSDGPMSPTRQDFYWNETLNCDCKDTPTGRN